VRSDLRSKNVSASGWFALIEAVGAALSVPFVAGLGCFGPDKQHE